MFTKICLFIVSFCWISSLNCCNIAYLFLISHIFPSEFFALLASHFLFFPLHTESQVLKNYKKTFFFLHSSKAFAQLIIVWYHCKCERVRVSLAHHLSLASCAVHRHDYIQHGGVGNLKFAHFGLLSCI